MVQNRNSKKSLLMAMAVGSFLSISAIQQEAHAGLLDKLFGSPKKQYFPPAPIPKKNPPGGAAPFQPQPQQGALAQMTQDERNALEEARLGRPMTLGEKEVKVAMDRFIYQPRVNMPIRITRTEWTEQDEVEFGRFIHILGQAVASGKCGTATKCLRNPEYNIYANRDPETLEIYTDCADLPYFLRAYFAYQNGLPFSYVTEVQKNPIAYASNDDQQAALQTSSESNSPYGNIVTARGGTNVPAAPGNPKNFISYVNNLINTTGTMTNRLNPMAPEFEKSDMFPVTLNRAGIRPGTIAAASGHAMIIWDVRANGEIHIIDGHPGSFIQEHLLESAAIKMSRPDQGIGFYQFRPMSLQGAGRDANGYYYGGRVVTASNQELIDEGRLSYDQWFGLNSNVLPGDRVSPGAWRKAFNTVSFFETVKAKLRSATTTADGEAASRLAESCKKIQERMKNYADSLAAEIPMTPHPNAMVQDVFGAVDATWEKYSTPGGDGRFKESMKDTVNLAISNFKMAKAGSKDITFKGTAQDYVNKLRQLIADQNATCAISYKNSIGKTVKLTFNTVTSRLNRMSFDPYMCPEKTWGASGDELATCRDGDPGNLWYNGQKYMRNTVGKTDEEGNPSIRSNRPITLGMLQDASLIDRPASSDIFLGTQKLPVMNLDAIFASDDFLRKLTN